MRAGVAALTVVIGALQAALSAPGSPATPASPRVSACACCATGTACRCGCRMAPDSGREPATPPEAPAAVSCTCGELPALPPAAPLSQVDLPRVVGDVITTDRPSRSGDIVGLVIDARAHGPPDRPRLASIVQLI